MRKRFWLVGLAVIVLCFLWPFTYLQAPQWSVSVTDSFGNPVEGITVRETYKNYTLESEGHESDLVTGDTGLVSFPEKRARSVLGIKIAGTIVSGVTGGVHASFGTHAHVFAYGNGREGESVKNGYIEDWTGSPEVVRSVIVVRSVNAL